MNISFSRKWTLLAVTVALFVAFASDGGNVFAQNQPYSEKEAQSIDRSLMCPVCPAETIDQAQVEVSRQMRQVVREMLSQGSSRDEILDFFVGNYGPDILGAPPKSGFNLLAWVVPGAAIIAALAVGLLVIRSMTGRAGGPAVAANGANDDLAPYLEAVDRDLGLDLGFLEGGGGHGTTAQGDKADKPTADKPKNVCEGLMAVGEAACVSVHGANRLGTNSLIDLVVFGKTASITAKEKVKPNSPNIAMSGKATDEILDRFDKIRHQKGDLKTGEVRTVMQHIMQKKCGVFRTQELIKSGIEEFDKAENSMENINIQDKSLIFNTDLTEALELYNLTAQSKVTLHSALNRKETRGAHAREDYSERDDENWLVHSLAWLTKKGEVKLGARPVHMNTLTKHVQSIPPKKRVY